MSQPHIQSYRSIFISDFHIGAKSFNALALLDFLKNTDSQTLYLVGDVIDGWKLSKRWFWPEVINEIFDELVRKGVEGTEIIYVPGNHDDAVRHIPLLRRLRYTRRLNIKISNTVIHKTADNRKFLVMHGDQFDTKILSPSVLKTHHKVSNLFGDFLSLFRKETPYIEINGKLKKFSLAKYLSKHGRLAIQTLNNFEGMVYKTVKDKHLDGIICGHTHVPALKKIKDITYVNTGSWLRSGNTAVVEDWSGNLSLLDWDVVQADLANAAAAFSYFGEIQSPVALRPVSSQYRPVTLKIMRLVSRLWPIQGDEILDSMVDAPSRRPVFSNLALYPSIALSLPMPMENLYTTPTPA